MPTEPTTEFSLPGLLSAALPKWTLEAQPRKDHNFRSEEVSGDAVLKVRVQYQTKTASGSSQGSSVLGKTWRKE